MDKQNTVYIYTVECYSVFKRKEMLTHATTWMNLEDIMLNDIWKPVTKGQILYDSTCMRHLE